jgi:hypothetical protein
MLHRRRNRVFSLCVAFSVAPSLFSPQQLITHVVCLNHFNIFERLVLINNIEPIPRRLVFFEVLYRQHLHCAALFFQLRNLRFILAPVALYPTSVSTAKAKSMQLPSTSEIIFPWV